MTKPSLLILSFSPIASDARVLKQVARFADEYDVTTCGYGEQPAGTVEHLRIEDDRPVWRYSRPNLIMRRYRQAYWGNAAISRAKELLAGKRFDIVLADDVDAVGLALAVKPRLGVHADLHEYSPRQHEEDWKFRIFIKPFIEWMIRTFVTQATSSTTVGKGIAAEYERRFGFRPDVVTNAAPYVEAEAGPVGTPIRLVHSGACLRNRNISAIVDAVLAVDAPLTLDLYLTPNDPGHLAELRAAAEASNGKITLHDPVPYRELSATLNAYDVGVHILPAVNFNNLWALPNKLFDYVQARLGVIVGPSPEMAAIVRERGLGDVTKEFTAEALAERLRTLRVDEVAGWKVASAASAQELSAETQIAVWASAIDKIATGGAR